MLDILISGVKETADSLRAAEGRFRAERLKAMRKILGMLRTDVQQRLAGDSLNVRSGTLRRSIGTEVREDGAEGRVGPQGVPYGRVHELGGTIKPVSAQWLTIPLDAAKTRAGGARGRARDFKDTFFLRHAGFLFLMQKIKNAKGGSQVIPLFILVKQVRIPARPYLAPVVAARTPLIGEMLGDAYMAAVEGPSNG